MYITPTVTVVVERLAGAAVEQHGLARASAAGAARAGLWISSSVAPSNTGVATWTPRAHLLRELQDRVLVGRVVDELARSLVARRRP